MARRVSRARLGAERTSRSVGCTRQFGRRERSELGRLVGEARRAIRAGAKRPAGRKSSAAAPGETSVPQFLTTYKCKSRRYNERRSGSQGPLLAPSPLRTVRESLPSHGSSISNAPLEGRAATHLAVATSRYTLGAPTRIVLLEGAPAKAVARRHLLSLFKAVCQAFS
jgi:hypothetical protein